MKFGKRYTQYVEKEGGLSLQGCSYVEFKRHKKLLKRCCLRSRQPVIPDRSCFLSCSPSKKCPSSCAVCDGNFFPNLLKEVSDVAGCFNARARRLLDFHLSSKFQRLLLRMKHGDHGNMIEEGRSLVNYASMNATAIRKILKKYDKVHCSAAGRAFKTRLQAMHVELLQSPWLIELSALYINLRDANASSAALTQFPESFSDCCLQFEDTKPTICCTFIDSQTYHVDLTCPICLDTVFEPVALGCGHIFCNSCACSAASIPTIQGIKSAEYSCKCPLCRQIGAYVNAVFLTELNIVIKNRCKEYWGERLQRERIERVQQVKQHWDKQMKVAMGISS